MYADSLNYRDGKKEIGIIPKKGEAMGTCATFSRKYICCRVHVLRTVQNCPFECSYCFLQHYLTDGLTKAVDDTATLMQEVKEKISRQPRRLFRIGTWELGDSLALEEKTGQAAGLVREFARLDNAVLELKTKSDCVEPILGLEHRGKTVVSWSLNTGHVIETEEHLTPSLGSRLQAMGRAAAAGYLIGLHFDPMILYEGWEQGYESLARQVSEAVPHEQIAWISIGSLRFNPAMKKTIENNYPGTRLTCAEMVTGDDGKMRYVKPLRVGMYRHMYAVLKKYISGNPLTYLCMERWDVGCMGQGIRPAS
ncbi:MAG: hypothetical protein GXP46_13150 [Deferribacteres bacterium]|nr:hypothetical protein [Deferribacteres bacterium]